MKVQGNVFVNTNNGQGLHTAANGTVYAYYTLSTGRQVLVRDAEGKPTGESTWENTYYSLVLFGELAKYVAKNLEAAKAQGKKVIPLEVSGEHETKLYTKKNGEQGIDNRIRVISLRTPGEMLWTTTRQGTLIQRQIN